jgi:hypothetical protein
MEQQLQHGPPFLPSGAPLGGIPEAKVDIPISAVFLVIYLLAGLTHAFIYNHNRKSVKTKFGPSRFIILFCIIRIATMSLRIAQTQDVLSINLLITARVFTTAGVLLLYLLNFVLSQRIMRSWHPRFGWSRTMSWAFIAFYLTVPLTLFALIGCFVDSIYALDTHTRTQDADVVKYGITYFLVVAAFPIPFIIVNWLIRKAKKKERRDEPKEERHQCPTMAGNATRSALVIMVAALLLVIGQIYRTGSGWAKPAPLLHPAWWDSKACFYVFEFVPEVLVIILYAVVRVDRLFFVPGKSGGEVDKISTIEPELHANGEGGHGRTNIISRIWHATFLSRLFAR